LIICLTILIFIVISVLWGVDLSRVGATRAVLNHFWYFSLLWMLFYPIRALLISENLIDLQIPRAWDDSQLFYSMLVAFLFWFISYAGYMSVNVVSSTSGKVLVDREIKRSQWVLTVLVFLSWVFIMNNLFINGEFTPFVGNEQNEARTGSGPMFLFAELYIYAFVVYLGVSLSQNQWKKRLRSTHYILIAMVFITSTLLMVGLASRRILAQLLLAMVVVYLVKKGKGSGLAILAVLATIFLAPFFQILRYINLDAIRTGDLDLWNLFEMISPRLFLTNVSSSFEGIDHLGAFVEKANWIDIIIGVDAGAAWVFNAFLGLVPRVIWTDKPEIYGSVAEQFFLYPWMYVDGAATTTLPVSYITDFIFGFGILFGLVMAFFLGRLLKVLHMYLWQRQQRPVLFGMSLFLFLNVFNVLRAGTGMLQGMLTFLIIACFIFGFAKVKVAVTLLVKDVLNFRFLTNTVSKPIADLGGVR